jgi:hypothetical protein
MLILLNDKLSPYIVACLLTLNSPCNNMYVMCILFTKLLTYTCTLFHSWNMYYFTNNLVDDESQEVSGYSKNIAKIIFEELDFM